MPYCVGRKRHSHLECVCQVLAEDKTSALYSQVRQRLLCLCETLARNCIRSVYYACIGVI